MASVQHHSQSISAQPSSVAATLGNFPISSLLESSSQSKTWIYTTVAVILGLLALEQSVYRYKKSHLPGAKWTIPIIGKFADSLNPTMEGYQRQWASGALSAISVFHIFIVMASTRDYAIKIFNSPNHAEPCLVNSAKQVLMPDSWVFLTGKAHVDYRRGLNGLFTRKALGIYLQIQDALTRKHFAKWLSEAQTDQTPKPIMFPARVLSMDLSLRVFCGPHISDEAAHEITDKYWLITRALELVNFPFAFPGTKVYKAIQARKVAIKFLSLAAERSKISMAAGNEPECMLDAWIRELESPTYKGRRDFDNREMAMVLFSFLFASQDALSSAVIYGFQHLADHPDILAKVQEEQDRVRGGDAEKAITLEMMDEMPYLRAFVKESLRVKPPVTMVPYRATKAFNITPDYTVPAHSMVIPSIYPSLHDPEVYPDPSSLKPERWADPQGLANSNPRNYLVFGSGPHKCIAYDYATMSLALVLANASMLLDWEHVRTAQSDEVQIIATLFPKDGCLLRIQPRVHS